MTDDNLLPFSFPAVCEYLSKDPAFKLACGRLPDSGVDLCSQPTLSRRDALAELEDPRGADFAPSLPGDVLSP